ncbi:UNVERIFIED_CONTAM: hypothetical protein Slati_3873000 [Sesamum latifolium]|uniref:Uncharacterized protein n=1 Tax=Sesamum latifolium TaxID=2727402 RepID=A0AAW2TLG9_9LAMI
MHAPVLELPNDTFLSPLMLTTIVGWECQRYINCRIELCNPIIVLFPRQSRMCNLPFYSILSECFLVLAERMVLGEELSVTIKVARLLTVLQMECPCVIRTNWTPIRLSTLHPDTIP